MKAEVIGRVLEDDPLRIVYQVECSCGWWGLVRIRFDVASTRCRRCSQWWNQLHLNDEYKLVPRWRH